MKRLNSLEEWLSYIYSIHPKEISLGLERIQWVMNELNLSQPQCPVIIVGGTNGKGSTVSGLNHIYRAAGYRVGVFTSPFLFKHNEQVKINDHFVKDEEFCLAFQLIESKRQSITLTTFEFNTLAALLIFKNYLLDVLILEVGLGGRLDAVNVIDATLSIITSISLDHMNYLGETREKIAFEKAGIIRKNKPIVCGCFYPPSALTQYALQLQAPIYYQRRTFQYKEYYDHWTWQYRDIYYHHLPLNNLYLQNMSTALMAITLLSSQLPVSEASIVNGLKRTRLTGRIEIIKDTLTTIYDVSHNPAAIALLNTYLSRAVCHGKSYGIFSMLGDKDIVGSINSIKDNIDYWYVAPLSCERRASLEILKAAFSATGVENVFYYSSLSEAFQCASQAAHLTDRLVVFGSFYTVSSIKRASTHFNIMYS